MGGTRCPEANSKAPAEAFGESGQGIGLNWEGCLESPTVDPTTGSPQPGPSSAASVLLPYITRPAIDWARRHRADLDAPFWREVEGSMVLGDVSGFTKMSERLARHGKVGAEEVADAINTCFEQLLDGGAVEGA